MDRPSPRSRTKPHVAPKGGNGALAGLRLDVMPGHLLRRCQQRAVDLFAAEVGEDGPTPRQFAALLCIQQNPGASQTELVRLSGIDRSTLAEMLRRLKRRGLIAQVRTARDQRANALTVTPSGEALLARTVPALIAAQERILAPVPEALRPQMLELLRMIADLPDGAERA
jgi:DNA-binding MarR family transcriptional regulator